MTLRFGLYILFLAVCASAVACSSSESDDTDGSSSSTDASASDASTGDSTATTDSGSASDGGSDGSSAGNTDSLNDGNNSNDLSAISGLWDITATSVSGLTDVYYLEIFADGLVVEWDYLADSHDQGDNCYDRFQYTGQNLGNNLYSFLGKEATIIAENGFLIVVEKNGTFVFPEITEFTSAEFNEC